MPSFLIVFILLLLFIAIVGAMLSLFLPGKWSVSSTISIKSNPKQIFQQINRSKNWHNWTVWSPLYEETIAIELGEVKEGMGAIQSWSNAQMQGVITIVESVQDENVQFHFDLDNQRFIVYSKINIQQQGDLVNVNWVSKYKQDGLNPLIRLQSHALKKLMLSNKQISLSRLKSYAERP